MRKGHLQVIEKAKENKFPAELGFQAEILGSSITEMKASPRTIDFQARKINTGLDPVSVSLPKITKVAA